jgi:hypothetical protein
MRLKDNIAAEGLCAFDCKFAQKVLVMIPGLINVMDWRCGASAINV